MKQEYQLICEFFQQLKSIYKEQKLTRCVLHIRNKQSDYAYLELESTQRSDDLCFSSVTRYHRLHQFYNLPAHVVEKNKEILNCLQGEKANSFKVYKGQSLDMFIHEYFAYNHAMLLTHHDAKVEAFHNKLDKKVNQKINELKKVKI